jgi:hypothetical protein
MNSTYTDHIGTATASSSHEDEVQKKTGNFLYQAATVLAILLFLISF